MKQPWIIWVNNSYESTTCINLYNHNKKYNKYLHISWDILLLLFKLQPHSRLFNSLLAQHLPAVRAVQGDCQWPFKNGGNSHCSYRPRINCDWGIPNLYLDYPITKGWCQPIWGHVSYPTDSPISNMLRLCNSLASLWLTFFFLFPLSRATNLTSFTKSSMNTCWLAMAARRNRHSAPPWYKIEIEHDVSEILMAHHALQVRAV